MKRRFGQKRIRFTPDLWAKWHPARDIQDSSSAQLREGIQAMRFLLASRDLVLEREWKLP